MIKIFKALSFTTLGFATLFSCRAYPQNQAVRVSQSPDPTRQYSLASSQNIQVGPAKIRIDRTQGTLDLPTSTIFDWVQNAVHSVTAYYGQFPVSRARIVIIPVAGSQGIVQGTTWGDIDGFSGLTRIRLGERTTQEDLAKDWAMTHELVHMAFPDLPDNQHWLEEGLATYIEPIARAQTGQLPETQVWGDMVNGMPQGEPHEGDLGLDHTQTWARTYWGGAMFCLVADVSIRRQTGNSKGLQDALRAIVDAGGTIDKTWPLLHTLALGDQATGTTVLTDLYKKWSSAPAQVDLNALWNQLGIHSKGKHIEFESTAPLAQIREAITAPKPYRSK